MTKYKTSQKVPNTRGSKVLIIPHFTRFLSTNPQV